MNTSIFPTHGNRWIIAQQCERAVSDLNQDDTTEALFKAIEDNDIGKSLSILQSNKKFNFRSKSGDLLLNIACDNRNYTIIQKLLERGADVNEHHGRFGETALHRAALHGYDEIIQMLLQAGAGLDSVDCEGKTAFNYAVRFQNISTVSLLLTFGSLVQDADLKVACSKGSAEIVALLLDHNPKLDIDSALFAALENSQILKLLLDRGANKEIACTAKEWKDWRPLHFAAFRGYLESVQCLVERGADLQAKNATGRRPLELAYVQYRRIKKLGENCTQPQNSPVVGEENVLTFEPRTIIFLLDTSDALLDILLVFAAAAICGAQLIVVGSQSINDLRSIITYFSWQLITHETPIIETVPFPHIRMLRPPDATLASRLAPYISCLDTLPPHHHGRVELIRYVREVTLSYDFHRYGNLYIRH